MKSLAFGSSVPEIDPADLGALEVVRLPEATENSIAGLAEESAESRAAADLLEREMAQQASEIIIDFMAGKKQKRGDREPQQIARRTLDVLTPDA